MTSRTGSIPRPRRISTADLFPYVNAQNFLGRDKELSTFTSHGIRLGVGYEMPLNFGDIARQGAPSTWSWITSSSATTTSATCGSPACAPGTEPLYDFSADVIQLFFSVWF